MGIGIPGSGKTTVLKKLAETLPAVYVCPDDIRAEVSGGDPTNHDHEDTVWALARIRSLQALEGEKNVIIDATFTRKEIREEFAELLREGGAVQIIGAYADISPAVAHERNKSRERVVDEDIVNTRYELLQRDPPALSEGFDAIVPLAQVEKLLTPDA